MAAALGREFSYELLAAITSGNEAVLQGSLGCLVGAGLVFQRGTPPHATYLFKHALVQDMAYSTLLRSQRQAMHGRIAARLKERFAEKSESQPELLARHFTEAGQTEEAITYWSKAGQQAVSRFANKEAEAHLTKVIELLQTLPEDRSRDERGFAPCPRRSLDCRSWLRLGGGRGLCMACQTALRWVAQSPGPLRRVPAYLELKLDAPGCIRNGYPRS